MQLKSCFFCLAVFYITFHDSHDITDIIMNLKVFIVIHYQNNMRCTSCTKLVPDIMPIDSYDSWTGNKEFNVGTEDYAI